jgi:hypothetical protein
VFNLNAIESNTKLEVEFDYPVGNEIRAAKIPFELELHPLWRRKDSVQNILAVAFESKWYNKGILRVNNTNYLLSVIAENFFYTMMMK